MDMIDRYVYAVTHHLPAAQRGDIEKELRSLIDDMLQEHPAGPAAAAAAPGATAAGFGAADSVAGAAAPGGPAPAAGKAAADSAAVEAVLLELGDPKRLADNYRGTRRYVIGPAYFDLYGLVLRIVLIAVAFGITLAMGIEFAVGPAGGVGQALSAWWNAVYQGLLGAFAWVTLIFYLNERYNDKAEAAMTAHAKAWRPRDLQPLPSKASLLQRSDPIAAIVFTLLFMIWLNINPDIIGAYFQDGSQMVHVPLLNPATIRAYLPWIDGVWIVSLLVEAARLIVGRWTIPLTMVYAAGKVPPLVLGVWILSDPALINPGFFSTMSLYWPDIQLAAGWQNPILTVLIGLAIFGFVVDMISLVVRAIRLAVQHQSAVLQ